MGEVLRFILFLPRAASGWATKIDHLHFFVISVTMAGAAVVGITAVVFIVRYHATDPETPTPRVSAPRSLEFAVGGSLLSLFILWWVIGFYQYVHIETPPPGAMEVYVTAKQWMWKFSQPNGLRSAGVLVVPQSQTVRLLITSRDVIHSFYVPSFRVKQDAVPGRYSTIWFRADAVGTYPVYCAEYCGVDHSRMWASVVVLDAEDYARWIAGGMPPAVAKAGGPAALGGGVVGEGGITSMADQGRDAASRYGCFSCHTIDGQPHIGPTWQGLYLSRVPLADGSTVLADEEYLTRSMMDPVAQVVKGFPTVMPTFQGVLKQPDAAAIVEFIKSLRYERAKPLVNLPEVTPVPSARNPYRPPAKPSPGEGETIGTPAPIPAQKLERIEP
jgi:cytochrome c oxidase subunit 2